MPLKKPIKLMNTLSGKTEIFKPLKKTQVTMYNCGPTVYSRAHIGNLRAYILADTLKRILQYANYKVKQVINITDVGHLTSDSDEGEDKLQKAAKETKTTAWEISKNYTKIFLEDIKKINVTKPTVLPKATDHIKEQIQLIKKLEQKKYTYKTEDGIYFDTKKFKKYNQLKKENKGMQAGKRIEMKDKKNKTDFALWKFSPKNEKRDMEWKSPWGKGFPGWHIECSAMAMKYLGKTLDIHTGGIDHIPIHHTNEIAQSEAGTGKKFVNYWLHNEFLVLKKIKMSKSKNNSITLGTLEEQNIDPLTFRYFCLGTHYRKNLMYSEDIIKNTQHSYEQLIKKIKEIKQEKSKGKKQTVKGKKYVQEFEKVIFNDLNTSKAIAILWEVINDKKLEGKEKITLIELFDQVLGLNLKKIKTDKIPVKIKELAKKRENLRKNKKWAESDKIRDQIQKLGYTIKDTEKGTEIESN